jgi:mono/diheme cytochrome c family protein
MRNLIGIIIAGIVIVVLGGAFFVARPIMALVRGTAVSPTAPITQTMPVNPIQPTPFANILPDVRPNSQHQGWGMGSSGRNMGQMNWDMYEGNWNMQGGMMGMNNCDRRPGNWNNTNSSLLPGGDTAVSPHDVSFSDDIQPIFNARCISCHGGVKGLYLTSYEDMMQGGVNGPVIVPGNPNNSRLIGYVSDGYMPLGGPPLSIEQIQTLANWVVAGAPNN